MKVMKRSLAAFAMPAVCLLAGCVRKQVVVQPCALSAPAKIVASVQPPVPPALPEASVCPAGFTHVATVKRSSGESAHPGVLFVQVGDVWLVCVDKGKPGSERAAAGMQRRDNAPPEK